MHILNNLSLEQPLDYYYTLPEGTYIYVPNLTFNGGIRLIKEALVNPNIKIYKGDARRKTEKQRWFQHLTVGHINPKVFMIKLSNGVKILDYSKFDPISTEKLTVDEMAPLTKKLVELGAPITPSSIIRQNIPLLNIVQGKNGYGAIINPVQKKERMYSHLSLFGGAVYNMRKNGAYSLIDYETHIDYHQMYAYIMMNRPFPDVSRGFTTVPGYESHPLGVYHICGGKIKLKKNGFPLIALDSEHDMHREEYFKDYVDIPWQFLTEPDLNIILDNFDIDEENPIEIDETLYYNYTIDGGLAFGKFIKQIYSERQAATEPAIKRFYKMINEYMPGSFERKSNDGELWFGLDGPVSTEVVNYNSIIGAFITAYGRSLLNNLLHKFPYKKVIGYDTDCVFFHGKPEEVPTAITKLFGDGIGQLHFDGIYTQVRHLAPKQYYGLDNGQPFGKFSAVPHGDEVAATLIAHNDDLVAAPVVQQLFVWDCKTHEYSLEEIPARISLDNYQRNIEPIKKVRGVWKYE